MTSALLCFVRAELARIGPARFGALSKESGVPLGTIRKVHYGEVADPRISTVQSLHDCFVGKKGASAAIEAPLSKPAHTVQECIGEIESPASISDEVDSTSVISLLPALESVRARLPRNEWEALASWLKSTAAR